MRRAGDEIEVYRSENFVAFVGGNELAVESAAQAAPLHAQWDNAPAIDVIQGEAAWLRTQPTIDNVYGAPDEAGGDVIRATFSRPYVAHASLAPSCALALFSNEQLTVWSHGQGMHPLRQNIADVIDLNEDAITA